ncbi:MAG: phosphogluconate dehydrogenase C-terminal domain-containing protein, partial [Pseudomonadota bacterium]
AGQAIVSALMQGPEEHFALCEEVAKLIYQPVIRSHRTTVEGMALLEPALSETIGATLVTALREATDAVVAKGVPKEAAMDFMLGHLGIELAILFEEFPGQFSDGAKLAIAQAKPKLLRDDWLRVLEPDEVMASVKAICNG